MARSWQRLPNAFRTDWYLTTYCFPYQLANIVSASVQRRFGAIKVPNGVIAHFVYSRGWIICSFFHTRPRLKANLFPLSPTILLCHARYVHSFTYTFLHHITCPWSSFRLQCQWSNCSIPVMPATDTGISCLRDIGIYAIVGRSAALFPSTPPAHAFTLFLQYMPVSDQIHAGWMTRQRFMPCHAETRVPHNMAHFYWSEGHQLLMYNLDPSSRVTPGRHTSSPGCRQQAFTGITALQLLHFIPRHCSRTCAATDDGLSQCNPRPPPSNCYVRLLMNYLESNDGHIPCVYVLDISCPQAETMK